MPIRASWRFSLSFYCVYQRIRRCSPCNYNWKTGADKRAAGRGAMVFGRIRNGYAFGGVRRTARGQGFAPTLSLGLRPQLRRNSAMWKKPKIVEIAVGMEINSYACAVLA